MKKKTSRQFFMAVALLLVTGFQVVAQDSTFFKIYNFDQSCGNKAFSIVKTSDGGLILGGGFACAFFTNDWMYFKTDAYGEVEWFTNYESVNSPDFQDMLITENEDVFSVGQFYAPVGNYYGGYYPGIARVSPMGDSLWWKTNTMEGYDTCTYNEGQYYGISETTDGNLLLSGYKEGCMHGNHLLISKVSPTGETLWMTSDTVYDEGWYWGMDAIQASNGSIYQVGWGVNAVLTNGPMDRITHTILVNYNQHGVFYFSKMFHEDTEVDQTQGSEIIEINNKLVLGGTYLEGFEDENTAFYLVFYILDYQGIVIDKKYITAPEHLIWNGFGLHGMKNTSDGGFIAVGGGSYDPTGTEFGWMARYNANAERLWFKTLGDTTGQEFSGRIYDVVELDDGRLAFAGSRKLSGQNAESFLLVTDAWGNGDYPSFDMDISAKETLQCQTCLLYPNPANEYIWVDPETKTEQAYTMYDVTGKPVKKGLVKGKTRLSLANLRPGMYIFKSEFCRSQRIIIN